MVPKFTEYLPTARTMAIRLTDGRNTDQVFWSSYGNSYVLCKSPTGFFATDDGTPCDLVSINGIGELRWIVSSRNGNTSGDVDAARYFGLTWRDGVTWEQRRGE